MQYRPEIDGLRAVAVIPVILFHAGFGLFAGGFVGVDVFFVISGYLITSIILEDLLRGRFSILRFYERRARRILPALFFVLLSVLPFAWLWMLPSQFEAFMKALVSVCLFASNIFFWSEAGYFDQASELKPLLHTWSLAVEEQYYVFFPLLLAGLWRFGRNPVFGVVLVLGAVSFVYAEYAARNAPDAAFFLLPARAWELLGGSVCAFTMHRRSVIKSDLGAAIGLALIVYAIFAFDEHLRWPSVYALAPVLGTMLIILFGHPGTFVARALSLRGVVGLGLISYSAYLWHQPIFALVRIRSLYPPDAVMMLGLSVLSLVLAYVSWKYVEAPFRHKSKPALPTQTGVFAASLAMLVAVGLFATTFALRPDWRMGEQVVVDRLLVDPKAEQQKSWSPLNSGAFDTFPTGPVRRVLIVGDSHSKDIFNALHLNTERWPDTAFRRAKLHDKCRTQYPDADTIEECLEGTEDTARVLLEQATDIILSARWLQKKDFPNFLPPLVEAFRARGKNVILTSSTVEFDPEAPVLLRRLATEGPVRTQDAARNFFLARDEGVPAVNLRLRRIAAQLDIPFIDKTAYMCAPSQQTCTAMTPQGDAVIYDYGHYTLAGATWFGARMADIDWLAPALNR